MFSMITNQAIQECGQIDRQIYELSMQLVELERAIGELQGLSGMEDIIIRLTAQHAQMEQEYTALRQMALGLEQAVCRYEWCERKICDTAGQKIIIYHEYFK